MNEQTNEKVADNNNMLTRISNSIYWLFLSLWFGSVVMSGVTAAIAFPTLRDRGVLVPSFGTVNSSEHFKIAAGSVMYNVFFVTDIIQLVSVIIVTAVTGAQLSSKKVTLPKIPNLIRLGALVVVLLTVSYQILVLSPRMNGNLTQYWKLAENGQDGSAYQQAFEDDHPVASRVLTIDAFALLVLVISSGYMMIPSNNDGKRNGNHPSNQLRKQPNNNSSPLEEPAILHQQHP